MPSESPLDAFFTENGAMAGSLDGERVVLAFPCEEQRAALHGLAEVTLIPWSHRGRLRVSGTDRIKFLQSQCTQDLVGRAPFWGGHAFMLEAKGRVIADPRILITPEAVLLEVHGAVTAELLARLQRFVIAADVRIEDVSSEYEQVLLLGSGLGALASSSGVDLHQEENHGAPLDDGEIWVRDGSTSLPGARIWLRKENAVRRVREICSLAAPSAHFAGLRHWHHLRVDKGLAWFGREIDGATLPVEAGLMEETVSLTKGCYCGQEVIARQHYLGKPRRRLVILEAMDATELQVGMEVTASDGKLLGQLSSVRPADARRPARSLAILKGSDHFVGQEYGTRPSDASLPARLVVVAIL